MSGRAGFIHNARTWIDRAIQTFTNGGWDTCRDLYDVCGHNEHRHKLVPEDGVGRDGLPLTVEGRS